jgi:hypothetical protein
LLMLFYFVMGIQVKSIRGITGENGE